MSINETSPQTDKGEPFHPQTVNMGFVPGPLE